MGMGMAMVSTDSEAVASLCPLTHSMCSHTVASFTFPHAPEHPVSSAGLYRTSIQSLHPLGRLPAHGLP